jgi:hypothetical protein
MTSQIGSSSRIFNIGSNNVVQYLNGSMKSNVVIKLPNLTFQEKNLLEVYLSVNHAEIPNSFFLINASNNQLSINGTVYTIPPANYNAINFLNTIQSGILSSFNITGTYNVPENKYTFTSAVAFTIDGVSTCSKFLGLTKGVSYTGTTIVSPFPLNFLPISRLNFHSTSMGVSNYNAGDNSFDIFLSCQNSSAPGSLILYNNYASLRYDVTGIKHMSLIDIKITDDEGNLIDFQNADWFLTLRLEFIYFLNPSSELDFTQMVNMVAQKQIEGEKKLKAPSTK